MVYIDDLLLEDFLASQQGFISLEALTSRTLNQLKSVSLDSIPVRNLSPWIHIGFISLVMVSLAFPIYKRFTASGP
jgi:hypothetical protein